MDDIKAEDFGLPETDIEQFSLLGKLLPGHVELGNGVIAELIKWDIINKTILTMQYNVIVPEPINYIYTTIKL